MDNFFSTKKLPDGSGPYNCPPKGHDLRDSTVYMNANEVAGIMMNKKGLKNAASLSQYIQYEGQKIMDEIYDYNNKNSFCFPNVCTDDFPTNITIKQMKEQKIAANNKWNKNFTKKGCNCLEGYRMTK